MTQAPTNERLRADLAALSARCRRLAYPENPPIFIEIADALDAIETATRTRPAVEPEGFDATDMEMIRRGDMLGPKLGARVADAPATSSPEGFVLVPCEPTGEMWVAGRKVYETEAERYRAETTSAMAMALADRAPEKIYAAMLAAAPLPPPASKPADDGWMEWNGRGRPVFEDDRVFIRQRGGSEIAVIAGTVKWSHDGRGHDIIAYRLSPNHEDGNAGKENTNA